MSKNGDKNKSINHQNKQDKSNNQDKKDENMYKNIQDYPEEQICG